MKQVTADGEAGDLKRDEFVMLASILTNDVSKRVIFEMFLLVVFAPLIGLQLVRWFASHPAWDPAPMVAARLPIVIGGVMMRSQVIMRFFTQLISNFIANKTMSTLGNLYFSREERKKEAMLVHRKHSLHASKMEQIMSERPDEMSDENGQLSRNGPKLKTP